MNNLWICIFSNIMDKSTVLVNRELQHYTLEDAPVLPTNFRHTQIHHK